MLNSQLVGTALLAASLGGHETIAKLMTEKGEDVNAQKGKAHQTASSGGNEAVAKLLMENRADVNAQGGWYGNALQAAASKGLRAVVKQLTENGADANAQAGSAHQAADSNREHLNIVVQRLFSHKKPEYTYNHTGSRHAITWQCYIHCRPLVLKFHNL